MYPSEPRKFNVIFFKDCDRIKKTYVCVPSSWILWFRRVDSKCCVVYPNEPDSLDMVSLVCSNECLTGLLEDEYFSCMGVLVSSTDNYQSAINMVNTLLYENMDDVKPTFPPATGTAGADPVSSAEPRLNIIDVMEELRYMFYNFNENFVQNDAMDPSEVDDITSTLPQSTPSAASNAISSAEQKNNVEDSPRRNSEETPQTKVNLPVPNALHVNGSSKSPEPTKQCSSPTNKQTLTSAKPYHLKRIAFPPEYASNSKSQLKYLERGPGREELMPGSGIYVNSADLHECIRISKDSITLERQLLYQVFSKNALRACTLRSERTELKTRIFSQDFERYEADDAPKLNKAARTVIYEYVVKHAREYGWTVPTAWSIKNAASEDTTIKKRVTEPAPSPELALRSNQKISAPRLLRYYSSIESDSDEESPPKRRKSCFHLQQTSSAPQMRTLKYPKPGQGLKKLVESIDIYVDTQEIIHSLQCSKDSRTLVRKLMEAIFTREALSKCSWSGKWAKGYDERTDRYRIRPALDVNGKNALLEFVKAYSAQKHWSYDQHDVTKTARNYLYYTCSRNWSK